MIARLLLALALVASVLAPSVRAITTTQYCQEPVETEFVRLLNIYRAEHGAGPVIADQVLSTAAEHHAIDMGQRNVLDHNLGDGTDFGTNITNHGWINGGWLGEVAAGSYASAADTLNQLKGSPSHNEILLDPKYVSVGVGRYDDGGKTQARYWWIGDFSSSDPMQPVVVCGVDVPSPTLPATAVPTPTRTATSVPTRTATPPVATSSPTRTATPTPTITNTVAPTLGPTYTVPDDPTSTASPSATPKIKRCPTRNPHYPTC